MVRLLEPSETHEHSFALDAGQFLYGEVDQRSVDVVVSVRGPAGRVLATFDGPARGTEFFEFVTHAPGTYDVLVTPYGDEQGEYALELLRVEEKAVEPVARIDQILARYEGSDRPGVVVAHVRNGDVAFSRGYGMAHLQWGIPNADDIKFNLGSASKQFTGFAVLLLEQRGRLTLDQDVREFLPELPDLGPVVTIENLLTHTSGYRELLDLLYMTGREPEDQFDQQEVLIALRRQPALQDEPGTVFRYNNSGYLLAALVVERVSGRSFSDFLEEEVFGPLGMHDTEVRSERGKIIPRAAEGYQLSAVRGFRRGVQNAPFCGPSNVYSTVHDLARWMRQLKTGELGGKELVERLTTPMVLADGTQTIYALGLRVDEDRGLRRFRHSGGAMSFRSWFAYYPDLDEGLVLLSNTSEFHRESVGEIADLLVPRPGGSSSGGGAAGSTTVFPPDPIATGPVWEPDAEELAACSGRFFSDELQTIWRLVPIDGVLHARHHRLGDRPLVPSRGDRFRGDYPFEEIVLRRSGAGTVTGFLASTRQNRGVLFERMD